MPLAKCKIYTIILKLTLQFHVRIIATELKSLCSKLKKKSIYISIFFLFL